MPVRLLLEGPDLEALLARVRAEHGPGARIVSADRVRTGGVAGFFARERYALSVEVDTPTDTTAILELAAQVEAAERARADAAGPAPERPAPERPAGPPVEPPVESAPEPEPDAGPGAPGVRPFVPPVVPRAVPAPVPPAPPAPRLPDLLPDPPAPWVGPGEVLAVVGEGGPAYEAARAVARRLRLDPDAVRLAAPTACGTGLPARRRITGPEDARRQALRFFAAATPTVVAVDAPPGRDQAAWALEVCLALRVAAVWAAVDATRKPADLARTLHGLGRVEALAVHRVAECADPTTVLDLGVPVALLDGLPATRAVWVALLEEQGGVVLDRDHRWRRVRQGVA